MHMASMQGNTRLVGCLVYSGCPINIRDGIGQTPLTLALHMGHTATAKFLVENGASVREALFKNTVSPLEIAKLHADTIMIDLIERKLKEENEILSCVASNYIEHSDNQTEGEAMEDDSRKGAVSWPEIQDMRLSETAVFRVKIGRACHDFPSGLAFDYFVLHIKFIAKETKWPPAQGEAVSTTLVFLCCVVQHDSKENKL